MRSDLKNGVGFARLGIIELFSVCWLVVTFATALLEWLFRQITKKANGPSSRFAKHQIFQQNHISRTRVRHNFAVKPASIGKMG